MINGRLISRILGMLLVTEALLMCFCGGISLVHGEEDLYAFLWSALVNVACGSVALLIGRNADKKFTPRDGYFVVSITWILCSLGSVLPFYLGGYVPTLTDGFFESMSGFTTTGFSIIEDVEALPYGILFWRALIQWIGGLGIVLFTIAVLPFFGVSGMQLFAAEATGPTKDKLHPRIGVTARRILGLYVGLTATETLLLWLGKMPFFDSICFSFATIASGGFSIRTDSIMYYHSPYIEYVISAFMFLSGISFFTLFLFLKGKYQKLLQQDEFRWYLKSVIICVVATTLILLFTLDEGIEQTFRMALFQVLSMHTSTGFMSVDYTLWTPFILMIFLFLTISGGSSGSTTGGVKCIRLFILQKAVRNEFKRIIHPNAVLPLRVNKRALPPGVVQNSLIFILLFMGIAMLSTFVFFEMGFSFIGSMSFVLACMGNTGSALGEFGPISSCNLLPEVGKWFAAFLMLLGRLELYTVLLLFTGQFWRR